MILAGRRRVSRVIVHEEACTGCGLCIAVCSAGCLELSDAPNRLGSYPVRYTGHGCRGDAACFRACPEPGAIRVRTAAA